MQLASDLVSPSKPSFSSFSRAGNRVREFATNNFKDHWETCFKIKQASMLQSISAITNYRVKTFSYCYK